MIPYIISDSQDTISNFQNEVNISFYLLSKTLYSLNFFNLNNSIAESAPLTSEPSEANNFQVAILFIFCSKIVKISIHEIFMQDVSTTLLICEIGLALSGEGKRENGYGNIFSGSPG